MGAGGASQADAALDARGFKVVIHKNKFGQDYKSTDVRY